MMDFVRGVILPDDQAPAEIKIISLLIVLASAVRYHPHMPGPFSIYFSRFHASRCLSMRMFKGKRLSVQEAVTPGGPVAGGNSPVNRH